MPSKFFFRQGDQYDVREKGDGGVRNHGKPVALAERYYQEGADEAGTFTELDFLLTLIQEHIFLVNI